MRIIIDTNMIFSLLLGKNAEMRDTFFDPTHIFYAPNYIIGELFEKKEKIMRCSALSEAEIYELFHRILARIEFVAENFISSEYKSQAFRLCRNIDEDDIPFIALSLQLNALFWSGDNQLKKYLKEHGFALFFEPKYESV
jgi:predicted nucleic acid-binding protein